MDKLFIRNLRVLAWVGIFPYEKIAAQTVLLDIVFSVDTKYAASSDDLKHTIDYASIRESIIEFLNQNRFNLVETLADRCANFLLNRFSIQWLQLSVTKLFVFDDAQGGAGVIIERMRA
ncbi:dihydroneopterin aldolase [Coxiella endosymbiont of Amblyomma nuttalli]|uniref:dihydroneopterin aldolase n=1 Tax=Coxiella endosymbiont of Amblyomma nuttalli TaxID=2749996 RepID=UPI001BA88B96|nr:dihydroneopterin aldolase [Coxiella endosymbiont of Amblyomma nuttalli]QTS83577.1 Dihydroneopterin aldolase [Coxiella endosymbiont of Amblyomma nuttalli]